VFGRVFASTLGLVILLRELGTAWSGAGLLLLPFHGLAVATLIVTVLAFPAALSGWPLPGGNHSAQPG
jgi:hypothetical protein